MARKKKGQKGKSPDDKESVQLEAPPAINLTESTESNKEDPAESGISSNVLEAGSTLHEGEDIENLLHQCAMTTLEQFPSWHSHKKKLHVELYKRFQKLGKLFPEPGVDPSDPQADDIQRSVANSFNSYLTFELTQPFIDFFTSVQHLDSSRTISSEYIQNWNEFFSILLFYLRQLVPTLAARFMCHRTTSNKKNIARMFKTDLKTKHLLHVAYLGPRGSLNTCLLYTSPSPRD